MTGKQYNPPSVATITKLGFMPPPTVVTLASPYTHAAGTSFANVPGMSLTLAPNEVWQLNVLLVFIVDANNYRLRFTGDNIDVFKAFSGDPASSLAHRSPAAYEYTWQREGVIPLGDPLQVTERLDLVARVYTGSSSQSLQLQAAKIGTAPGGDWEITEAQIIAQRIA